MPPKPRLPAARLTHIARLCFNLNDTSDFYRRYTHAQILLDRREKGPEGRSERILWLGEGAFPPGFILVLTQGEPSPGGAFDHLGLALSSADEVDHVASIAKEEGTLQFGPQDLGEVAGYLCTVRDPDGHLLEFSYGQKVGPQER